MQTGSLHRHLQEFRSGLDLRPDEAEAFFDALIAETDEAILIDILRAWETKGVAEEELFALASILRKRMVRINTHHESFVDAVGTGGSRAKTFNVSTAAAFVIAGAGIPVAKHGNRAATSNSGSADVLSELGIKVDIEPSHAEECLNRLGICFMFAPKFHSLSTVLARVRRELGRPTIFNNLGPLCNPAGAPHQLIGVWHRDLVETTANVLARLGTARSWVVHGDDGLDEISLNGKTFVAEVLGADVKSFEISAGDFGVDKTGGDFPTRSLPAESARLIRDILENNLPGAPSENLVLINAAAAIYLAGAAENLTKAFVTASESIRSGSALEKMNSLLVETNK